VFSLWRLSNHYIKQHLLKSHSDEYEQNHPQAQCAVSEDELLDAVLQVLARHK
jgi:hypothetical protein